MGRLRKRDRSLKKKKKKKERKRERDHFFLYGRKVKPVLGFNVRPLIVNLGDAPAKSFLPLLVGRPLSGRQIAVYHYPIYPINKKEISICINRESNTGLIDGNDEFYH